MNAPPNSFGLPATPQSFSWAKVLLQALSDALIAGLLALIVLGPISGLILSGYHVQTHWERPLWIAALVAIGRSIVSLVMQTAWGQAGFAHLQRGRFTQVTVAPVHQRSWIWLIPVFIISFVIPFLLNKYWLTVLILALIYVLLGLGLNIVVGLAGMLDLGYVAFYAMGAYTLALGAQYLEIGFWLALPMAAVLAATLGVILGFPVLRMHGDYLAIVTLGFGEIIRLVLNNWLEFTGGPNGASAPAPTFFGLEFNRRVKEGIAFHDYFGIAYNPNHRYIFICLVLLIVVWLTILFVTRLKQMPMGRAWEALREDEIACRSLGINPVTVKLSAFAMGAMIGGIAGVFFATYQGFVNPTSFTFFESALILAIVVLGGLGSTGGVILAALVLTILPELLRDLADYRVLAFGCLMVLMMIWRPRGLVRVKRTAYDVQKL